MNQMVKILVAFRDDAVREAIEQAIKGQAGFQMIRAVSTGNEALIGALTSKPDLMLMDGLLPQLNGFEACRLIVDVLPQTKVILTSTLLAEHWVEEAARNCGAAGVLDTAFVCSSLVPTIGLVMQLAAGSGADSDVPGFKRFGGSLPPSTGQANASSDAPDGRNGQSDEVAGQTFTTQPITWPDLERVLAKLGIHQRPRVDALVLAGLTSREIEVAVLVGHGLLVREIAEELTIAPGTVKTLLARAREKLGCPSASHLRVMLLRDHIIEPQDLRLALGPSTECP